MQARTAQASEQLVEKTKGLEATQQELIDQLQVVQDQLQTVRRLLAAQQTETRKLSEQVGSLTGAIDGLRQSFASAQTSEPSKSAVGSQEAGPDQAQRGVAAQARQVARLSRVSGAATSPAVAPASAKSGLSDLFLADCELDHICP